MDEYIKDFLVETVEALAVLDNDLVRLEAAPGDPILIGSVFRTLHTIKGTCGFLGLSTLGRVAHAGENVLGRVRDGALATTPKVISAILHCVDAIKAIVGTIETTGGEGGNDYRALIAELDGFLVENDGGPASDAGDSAALQAAFESTPGPAILAAAAQADPGSPAPRPAQAAVSARPDNREPARDNAIGNQTIRVSIDLLEGLMTTVSELVLTRNQLLQLARNEKDSPFATPLQRLSMITSELQESVMKTRMQPIGNAWSSLPRIVRDLALELGKKIELVMEGADTELDRQVLELIKDPLTHMVRNAADHGLEPPADRCASGKPETGRIRLTAFHEGGHIVILIADDGRGLDVDRIRQKAVQNGLATEAEAASMSDSQVFRFVMRPGFSTAREVTAISGRGVGMDVVRTNIERIGGTIDIESRAAHGSTFVIKIPLTLAIVPALIVGCGGERFAIPQISVIELVRASATGEHRIERISDSVVLRLRDRLLPLVDLRALLGLGSSANETEERLVIVTQVGTWFFGIVVDRVYDTEEIVVKPVSPLLKSLSVYSGNTILGDGTVCMIMDPNGIVTRVGRIDAASASRAADDRQAEAQVVNADRTRLLLVRAGGGLRKAIPLDLIARLEEIDVEQIRRADDGRLLVRYRDSLMPLVPAAGDLALKSAGRQPVLVFANHGLSEIDRAQARTGRPAQIGVLVDEILDILEGSRQVELASDHPDVIGSALVATEPTEVLNVQRLLSRYASATGARRPTIEEFAA
jgi:two-component system chemotaxis sensor kinase CheA